MATNVQRGGLGFEKFFKRRKASNERTKDSEEIVKSDKNDADNSGKNESSKISKLFGFKSADNTNNPDDPKHAESETTETSEKAEWNKSSKKKNHSAESSFSKVEDKKEPCKEYVIKDDVGQVKLTEIINNSIKEAVLNIVKESVCPLGDTLDLRPKETGSKKCPDLMNQETQDKENKPGSPKHFSSLLSEANETFDSHLCRSHCPQSSRLSSHSPYKFNDQHERITANPCGYESPPCASSRNPCKSNDQYERSTVNHCSNESPPRTSSRSPCKSNDEHERVIVNHCSRETPQRANKNKKLVKCPKQKEMVAREVIPKICRQTKGQNSNFRSDNRRMTGNVNIYICSEANENTKDKQKSKNTKDCNDDTESATSSTLSTSTSKLVAALRKKQRKNLEDSCSSVCETSENSVKQYKSECKMSDGVFCLCDDDSVDGQTPDSQSGSSRDDWVCGGEKFSDPESDMGSQDQLYTSSAFDECASYDRDDFWPCNSPDCPSYNGSSGDRRFNTTKEEPNKSDRDDDDRCSCCNHAVCKKNRPSSRSSRSPSWKSQTETRKSRDTTSRTTRDSPQFNKCLCVVEEEDEGCCNEREKTEVQVAVCETPCAAAKTDEPDKSSTISNSDILKEKNSKSEENDEPGDDIEEKPEPPKLNLLSSLREGFKRSSSKEARDSKAESTNMKSEEDQQNSEIPKPSDDNTPKVGDEKQRNSFFRRSIKMAMGIVKARKSEDVNPITADDEETKTEGKDDSDQVCNDTEAEKLSVSSSCPLKEDNRCRSRIASAISSRRSCGATSNESSNVSIPPCQANKPESSNDLPVTENARKPESSQCCKLSERSDCCCKKPEPKEEVCKCHVKCRKTTSGTSVCCQKLSLKSESCACCLNSGNRTDKCVCCCKMAELIEPDIGKSCPRCTETIPNCTCCCSKQEMIDQDSDVNRSQINSFRPPPNYQETPCNNCCDPKAQCMCVKKNSIWEYPKSMICIYCDKPQDKCVCKAPIRKCSQCGLPQDVCNCKSLPCCDCTGRQINHDGSNDEANIHVTAWKPRRSVRRYFSRDQNDRDGHSEEDCSCFEKSMPYGSDKLPYQKGTGFSDVMSELQQKMSGSVCCDVCRNVPCNCCCNETEDKPRQRRRLGTITERRSVCQSQGRSRSKSPEESCRCGKPRRKSGKKVGVSKICGRCRTSPCRCRRNSASSQKKPTAKCYYCKSSPCVCSTPPEPVNLRPFRKPESSHRRRKDCNSTEEHTNADVENEDNGHRGRETNYVVVPCPGRQQPRKYRYRGNSNG